MTQMNQNRRRFLATLTATGAAGLIGPPHSNAQDGRLETTIVRVSKNFGICTPAVYVADDLLRAEGFTDIRYVTVESGAPTALALARGEVDFAANYSPPQIIAIDAGEPITTSSSPRPIEMFADGKIDAFLGFPPEPQELRARNIGRVIVNGATDRPWSQYFCCMLMGNLDYVRRNPVATKRFLRAIIKAADLCVTQPERVARRIVDAGLPRGTTMRSRRSRKSPTQNGGSTTPRTRSGSIRCGCARPALSGRLPARSLPMALIGICSTNSNAS